MSKVSLQKIQDEVNKSAFNDINEAEGTAARVINEQSEFHVVTLDVPRLLEAYQTLFPGGTTKDYDDIIDFLKEQYAIGNNTAETALKKEQARNKNREIKSSRQIILEGLLKIRDERRAKGRISFLDGAFNTAGRRKGTTLKAYLKTHPFFKNFDKKTLSAVGGKTPKGYSQPNPEDPDNPLTEFGSQLEHGGESLSGLPAAGVRGRLALRALVKHRRGLSLADFKRVRAQIERSLELTGSLERKIDFSADGKSILNYMQEVILTSTVYNQEGQTKEAKATKLLEGIGDITVSEGSDSLLEALSKVTLFNIAGTSRPNKKVTGQKQKRVKNKTTAKGKTFKSRSTESVSANLVLLGADPIIREFANKGKRRRGQRTEGSILSDSVTNKLGVFNEKLPEVVKRNMQEPRLQNRTGRFASSVRVTDITKTPKGFPSVGYTYDRANYEQYEVSSGSRYASAQRDPRALIDRSLREIAAGMMLGRFFTRRV